MRQSAYVIAFTIFYAFWIWLCFPVPVFPHDHWINHGKYKNAAGEHCCGEKDCEPTIAQHVSLPDEGYRLANGEFVPIRETQPSPDGQYWICRRSGDKVRRCFFAPPESN